MTAAIMLAQRFMRRAKTREGMLQVELAQLTYMLSKLMSVYTKFERQKGGIGLRGPGETKLEADRRMVTDRISDLLWTPSPDGDENLLHEGVSRDRIERVGNIMIDSLVMVQPSISAVDMTAVIGREFTYSSLQTIYDVPANLEAGLDAFLMELQRRELILEKSRLPQPIYTFKHVLIQETAYETLLLRRRREVHQPRRRLHHDSCR